MLSVLDGAVLVISAVEGVQAQTRVLMRTLQRLRHPGAAVREQDRPGRRGQPARAAGDRARLTPAAVPMAAVYAEGTPAARITRYGAADTRFTAGLAEMLADHDDDLLAALVEDQGPLPYPQLRAALAAQARQGLVHPVFFGSAITGPASRP